MPFTARHPRSAENVLHFAEPMWETIVTIAVIRHIGRRPYTFDRGTHMKGYCMLDSAVVKLADVANIVLEIRQLIKQRDSSTGEVM
jgi:hypothetical protein